MGVTSIGDPELKLEDIDRISDLYRKDILKIRLSAYLPQNDVCGQMLTSNEYPS